MSNRSSGATGVSSQQPAATSANPLGEFRQFIRFLQNLWTILASASVLFPLSNELARVIPISKWPDGGFVYLTSGIVTVVTTIGTLFLILWVFGTRRSMSRPGNRRRLPRRAAVSFAAGITSLLLYLLIEFLISHDFYFTVLGWQSGDLRCIVGDFSLLITYAVSFGALTHAFVLLGLREYLRRNPEVA